MSIARTVRRERMRELKKTKHGRSTCPKCHTKLVEKVGYGMVCCKCGWSKGDDDDATD